MKNIKLIFASFFLAAAMISCNDDGGDSVISLQTGAVPDIQKAEGSEAIINLLEIQEGNDISISFTADVAQGDISSLDIIAFYIKGDGTFEKVTLADNVTTFPTTITLSKQDLIDTFALLNSDADFVLGDQLKISADLILGDGTAVNLLKDDGTQNYGQDIANSTIYSVVQIYNVSCPSDIGGTYNVVTTGASTDPGPTPDENPIADYPYVVTLTDNGGGNYTMSDAFGGLYILWYDIYGLDFEVEATLTDVCGTLSSSFSDPFQSTVTITGVVNPDGTLSIHWENDFGDFGDAVYTKQ